MDERATQPQFVHARRRRPFDLVMRAKRQTMRRVRRFDPDQARDMRHPKPNA